MTNMILSDSHERVFSTTAGVEQVVLGLYIIRGDNMYVRAVWSCAVQWCAVMWCGVMSCGVVWCGHVVV
jgi:hypothetical protein